MVGWDDDWDSDWDGKRRRRGGEVKAIEVVNRLLSTSAVIRPRDLEAEMGSRWWLRHLVRWGVLVEVADGLFSLPGRRPGPSQLALARVSEAVLGLASALWAGGLVAEEPVPVHLVLERGRQAPRERTTPVCLSWTRNVGEGWIPVGRDLVAHRPERALIDCLRYRCGLPPDQLQAIAQEALATHRTSPGRLLDAADAVALRGPRRAFVEELIERWRSTERP